MREFLEEHRLHEGELLRPHRVQCVDDQGLVSNTVGLRYLRESRANDRVPVQNKLVALDALIHAAMRENF